MPVLRRRVLRDAAVQDGLSAVNRRIYGQQSVLVVLTGGARRRLTPVPQIYYADVNGGLAFGWHECAGLSD